MMGNHKLCINAYIKKLKTNAIYVCIYVRDSIMLQAFECVIVATCSTTCIHIYSTYLRIAYACRCICILYIVFYAYSEGTNYADIYYDKGINNF